MKIGIASDHAGYKVKEEIIQFLKNNYEIIDYGIKTEEPTDFPIYAFKIGEAINKKEIEIGILICYTGIGMSIACNKIKGIRCSKVDNIKEAELTKMHNDSNVLALSAMKNINELKEIIEIYLKTPFSNIEKYQKRNEMIDNYEC